MSSELKIDITEQDKIDAEHAIENLRQQLNVIRTEHRREPTRTERHDAVRESILDAMGIENPDLMTDEDRERKMRINYVMSQRAGKAFHQPRIKKKRVRKFSEFLFPIYKTVRS